MSTATQRDAIIEKARALPRMPLSVQQVMRLMGDDQADMGDISKAIEYDPGLTVNILSLANSSYFQAVREITSVREAVIRLGAKKVFQIVVAIGVVPHAGGEVAGYGLQPGDLIEHSVAVAVGTDLIGEHLGLAAPAHAFTAGLLCQVGKTILGDFLEPEVATVKAMAKEKAITFVDAEQEVLGIDYGELGGILMEHWGVPDAIADVVRYMPRPEDKDGTDGALDLVCAASMAAGEAGFIHGVDAEHLAPVDGAMERLGLSEGLPDDLCDRLKQEVPELKRLLMST